MSDVSRRSVCAGLVAMTGGLGRMLRAQGAPETPKGSLGEARAFPFAEMPVRKMANGGESRDALRGTVATGEAVAVHESVLPVGAVPAPLHTVQHSELILVRDGTVEFTHGDKTERVEAGGVLYVTPQTMHGLRNVGAVPARYFVVQVGGDTKR